MRFRFMKRGGRGKRRGYTEKVRAGGALAEFQPPLNVAVAIPPVLPDM